MPARCCNNSPTYCGTESFLGVIFADSFMQCVLFTDKYMIRRLYLKIDLYLYIGSCCFICFCKIRNCDTVMSYVMSHNQILWNFGEKFILKAPQQHLVLELCLIVIKLFLSSMKADILKIKLNVSIKPY